VTYYWIHLTFAVLVISNLRTKLTLDNNTCCHEWEVRHKYELAHIPKLCDRASASKDMPTYPLDFTCKRALEHTCWLVQVETMKNKV